MEALSSSKTNRHCITLQISLIYVSTPVTTTNVANTREVTFRQPVLWGSSVAHITVYVSVWVRLARSQCAPNRHEIERYPLLSYNFKMTVVEVQKRSFFRNIMWIFEDLQNWTALCHKHSTSVRAISATAFIHPRYVNRFPWLIFQLYTEQTDVQTVISWKCMFRLRSELSKELTASQHKNIRLPACKDFCNELSKISGKKHT
jgi:hypothetical protein